MSEKGKFKDILHYLEIRDLGDNGCSFLLCEGNNISKMEEYKTEECLIADPALDINFKALFIEKPERFANFLNCVFFYQRNKEISELEFLVGDFHIIGDKYNLNRLNADIACKGKIKEISKNDQKIIKDTLLDIEIQINWIEDNDNILFEYGSELTYKSDNKIREEQKEKKTKIGKKEQKSKKRIYLDTLVIAFIIGNKKTKSTEIKLIKGNDGKDTSIELNMFNIVEINVFNEYDLLKSSLKSPLLGQLSKDGQDWIKLISLRSWTKIGKDSYKYIFPKLLQGHRYSSNDYINETILELIHGNKLLNEIDLKFENLIKKNLYFFFFSLDLNFFSYKLFKGNLKIIN